MTVQFTENNGKDWIYFKGKYLNSDENSNLLISDDVEEILEDCANSCSKNDDCHWFVWNVDGGKCKQFKFNELDGSTFQWRYDSSSYNNYELPNEVFNLAHTTESQEQCMNDCYNDTNCVCTSYNINDKSCRIYYNYSNDNNYFGYYALTKNEYPQGGEITSKGDDIYNTEAVIDHSNSIFSLSNIILFILAVALVAFLAFIGYSFKKNKDKKNQETY